MLQRKMYAWSPTDLDSLAKGFLHRTNPGIPSPVGVGGWNLPLVWFKVRIFDYLLKSIEIHWNPIIPVSHFSENRFLFAETWYLRTSPRSWCPWGEGFEGRGKHSDLHCRSYKANGLTFRGTWGTPSNASGCKKQDCDLMGFVFTTETKQNKTCINQQGMFDSKFFNEWNRSSTIIKA